MKKSNLLLAILPLLLFTACGKNTASQNTQQSGFSDAGGVDGGGGKGVMCGNTLTTLDLYEARKNGLTPQALNGDLDLHLQTYGLELAKHFAASMAEFSSPTLGAEVSQLLKNEILNKIKDIPEGQKLAVTRDATLPTLPAGCSDVQIAVYSKDGTIYRDPKLWAMLPPVEQAALVLHEFVYYRARTYGKAANSDESRKVIGLILSGSNPEPMLKPIWGASRVVSCVGGIEGTTQEVLDTYAISEYENGVLGVGIYFFQLKGYALSSRTHSFLPGATLDGLKNYSSGSGQYKVFNSALNMEWTLELVASQKHARIFSNGENPLPDYSNYSCIEQ